MGAGAGEHESGPRGLTAGGSVLLGQVVVSPTVLGCQPGRGQDSVAAFLRRKTTDPNGTWLLRVS